MLRPDLSVYVFDYIGVTELTEAASISPTVRTFPLAPWVMRTSSLAEQSRFSASLGLIELTLCHDAQRGFLLLRVNQQESLD